LGKAQEEAAGCRAQGWQSAEAARGEEESARFAWWIKALTRQLG